MIPYHGLRITPATESPKRTEIWSSGGGVQSTAIAALIVTGQIAPPDLAVIADTGRERTTTWDYMRDIVMPALSRVGVQIHIVRKHDFSKIDLMGGADKQTLLIPAFTTASGEIGKMPAFCSSEWKRDVVRRWATQVHGVKAANVWIGFSTDENKRALKYQKSKKNQGKWESRFPLMSMGMSRDNCVSLVERMGWPTPPRSSCWMCPNHHMAEWRDIRQHPSDWKKLVRFDANMRKLDPHAWLTDECVPIDEAQLDDSQEVMFGVDSGGCDSGQCFV